MSQDQKPTIDPATITHPFQLMAAWFVMIILVDGTLLSTALFIQKPEWGAAFLIISAIVLTIIVMATVFAMLTIFRPNLQGPQEYSEWLKDSQKYRSIRMMPTESVRIASQTFHVSRPFEPVQKLDNQIMGPRSCSIEIAPLENAAKLAHKLIDLGFATSIYGEEFPERPPFRPSRHAGVWIGSQVNPCDAITAIKTAIEFWPHLRYFHLSSDGTEDPPKFVQKQIFLGGSTKTALEYQIEAWTKEEIERLDKEMSIKEFHALVRQKYAP